MAENIKIEFYEGRTAIYAIQEQIKQLQDIEDPYAEPIKYSIEEMFDKECVYVVVHEHPKIDTEVFVFQDLSKAVSKATEIAEDSINGNYSAPDEIEQLHWEGVIYCLHYPIEGYVWIANREVR